MKLGKRLSMLAALVLLVGTLAVPAGAAGEVVGQNETLLTAMNGPGARGEECTLGDAAADALRDYAGTDIAVLPGGVFAFNLLGGDVTEEDVRLIFPEDDALGAAEITGAQLWDMLERSVSAVTVGENDRVDWDSSLSDGFLQVSGFSFRFDASDPPGARVAEVTLDDGREISVGDSETVLTAASTAALLAGGCGYDAVDYSPLELTLPEAFIRYIAGQNGALVRPELSRIGMFGTADSAFLNGVGSSAVLFLACAGAIALIGALTFGRSPAWKALKNRVMPETEEEKESTLNRFMKRR